MAAYGISAGMVLIVDGVRFVVVREPSTNGFTSPTAVFSRNEPDYWQSSYQAAIRTVFPPRRTRMRDILAALPATEDPRKPPLCRLSKPPAWRGLRCGQRRKRAQHYVQA